MAGTRSVVEDALSFGSMETTISDEVLSESPVAALGKVLDHYEYAAAAQRLEMARRYGHHLKKLDLRFENLRRSQSWLAGQGGSGAAQLLLAYLEEFTPYLQQRELHLELLRWCKDGLRACERLQQPSGAILLRYGQTHYALGHWDEAIKVVQAAIEISPQEEDPDLAARATMTLGLYQVAQGKYQIGLETMERGVRLSSPRVQPERLVALLGERAAYALHTGYLDTALALYLQADHLQREAGAQESSDHTLLMLGVVYRRQKRYQRAEAYLQELLERAKARQHQETVATASHHLSWVWLSTGKTGRARQLCGEAITRYEKVSNLRGLADAYEQLGAINLAERHYQEAVSCLERSLLLRRQLGNKHGEASSQYRLALAHLALWHVTTALPLVWQSLRNYQRLGVLSRQRLTRMAWQLCTFLLGKRRWRA